MLDMEQALREYEAKFSPGQIVKGRVLEVRPHEVIVDIGYKSEGSIPISEFEDKPDIKAGDEVDVFIENLENKEGMIVLSHRKAVFKKNWERILNVVKEGGIVEGTIRSVVKGGFLVNIGVDAFLPASQVDITPAKDLQTYVGKTYKFKIVKLNVERQNIVLSRRELIEQERAERRAKLLAELMPGDIVRGTVKNITDFGAFIDLNGLDGLLHITDMSWGRISHPSEMLKIGDEIDVVVLDVNREKERVSLGLKQKTPNPWENIEEKYPVGSRVKGKVVSLVPYGAFVELEPGVEGLIHVTELSWTKRITRPHEVLKEGQEVEAVVLEVNPQEQKISLGVRQLEPNPWELAKEKYPPGTRVKGKVRNITSFGAFVEIEEGLDGMVHVSDISWTRKINHPSEVLKKGQEVEAVVMEVDPANQRISLSIKHLTEDPWENIDKYYKVGDLVKGKVTKLASFGAFVALDHDIDGLVHISQISEERVDKIKNVLKVGQEVTARVIKVDKAERRIGLSIKAANYTPEQLKAEQKMMESLKPGEDLVALEDAFAGLDQLKFEEETTAEGEGSEEAKASNEASAETASAESTASAEETKAQSSEPSQDTTSDQKAGEEEKKE